MKVNSDSLLAPAINESRVSAATTGQAAANRKNSVKQKPFMESPRLSRKYRVRVTSKQLFQVSCSCSYFPPEHEPRSRTRLVQQIFMRCKTDHLVLRRVSNHPQRIQTFLHCFNGFLIETTQKNNTPIRISQMFLRPVIDRPLAFLRDPILVSASKPVDRFIPFVDSGFALDKTLLRFILHNLRDRFAIDGGAEFHREVHRVGVVDGNAPTHHFSGAARLVLAGMALL